MISNTQGKGDLDAILEHFSLDVSNPCTVMSQDASRSFLHSGRDEDKYKFFMKATLLESVRTGLLLTEENVTQMQGHVQVCCLQPTYLGYSLVYDPSRISAYL